MKELNSWQLVARVQLGEAVDGGCGSICVEEHKDGHCKVYVDGGMLPDASEEKTFPTLVQALVYVSDIVRKHGVEIVYS